MMVHGVKQTDNGSIFATCRIFEIAAALKLSVRRRPQSRSIEAAAFLVFLAGVAWAWVVPADLFLRDCGIPWVFLHRLSVGEAPFVEDDDPVGNLFGCCRQGRSSSISLSPRAMSTWSKIPSLAPAVSTSASNSVLQAVGRSAKAFSKPSIQSSHRISSLRVSTREQL
jgi:hypothetical protein